MNHKLLKSLNSIFGRALSDDGKSARSKKELAATLGHEFLGHSYDFETGDVDRTVVGTGKSGIKVGQNEIDATFVENIIRSRLHLPLERQYNGIPIKKFPK